MESRVQKLEVTIGELNTEVRLMNQTLSSISETLSDFKDILKTIQKIEVEMMSQNKDIEANTEKVDYLIKTSDKYERRISELEKADVGTGLRVGVFEKITWLIIGGLVSVSVALFGGK